ncbi:hypothetical protein EVAR_46472_1 [Eumeta japonica]|uniref:Uncharacterized protein n=1 Tax=Eumeta variegata TaxID=151549 RepID=A0A4C1XHI6_EUMVA|nr:hypothetical protein EVAR_46472_1 [Eumeta japonica]
MTNLVSAVVTSTRKVKLTGVAAVFSGGNRGKLLAHHKKYYKLRGDKKSPMKQQASPSAALNGAGGRQQHQAGCRVEDGSP